MRLFRTRGGINWGNIINKRYQYYAIVNCQFIYMDNIARASMCDCGWASRGGLTLHLPLHLRGPDLHQVCQVSGPEPGKRVSTLIGFCEKFSKISFTPLKPGYAELVQHGRRWPHPWCPCLGHMFSWLSLRARLSDNLFYAYDNLTDINIYHLIAVSFLASYFC